jgi:hypothetical protein
MLPLSFSVLGQMAQHSIEGSAGNLLVDSLFSLPLVTIISQRLLVLLRVWIDTNEKRLSISFVRKKLRNNRYFFSSLVTSNKIIVTFQGPVTSSEIIVTFLGPSK